MVKMDLLAMSQRKHIYILGKCDKRKMLSDFIWEIYLKSKKKKKNHKFSLGFKSHSHVIFIYSFCKKHIVHIVMLRKYRYNNHKLWQANMTSAGWTGK